MLAAPDSRRPSEWPLPYPAGPKLPLELHSRQGASAGKGSNPHQRPRGTPPFLWRGQPQAVWSRGSDSATPGARLKEGRDSLSYIFGSLGPPLSAHLRPPNLRSHPSSQPSLPPGPRRPDSGSQRVEVSRAARGSGKDFERSDPFFTPTPGPRGPDSRFSRAARGNNLGKSTENSSPQPPLLRAGTQPPPRGVPTPGDRPLAAEPLGVPRVGAHTPAPGGSVKGSKGRSGRSGGGRGAYLGRKCRRE